MLFKQVFLEFCLEGFESCDLTEFCWDRVPGSCVSFCRVVNAVCRSGCSVPFAVWDVKVLLLGVPCWVVVDLCSRGVVMVVFWSVQLVRYVYEGVCLRACSEGV